MKRPVKQVDKGVTETSMFERFLGADWSELPSSVRDMHGAGPQGAAVGRASVQRGKGLLEQAIGIFFRFPKAIDDIDVQVIMKVSQTAEHWERRFGNKRFHSVLRPKDGYMTERFGPMTFRLNLHVAEHQLHYPVLKGWCLGVPMPHWALPRSVAFEYEKDGRFHFDVALYAPITKGLIVRYKGWLDRTVTLQTAN